MMPKQDKAQNLATKRMGKLNQVLEQINQEQAQQIVYKDRRIVELEHAVGTPFDEIALQLAQRSLQLDVGEFGAGAGLELE